MSDKRPDRIWAAPHSHMSASGKYYLSEKEGHMLLVEYVRKGIADGYKLTAQEERETKKLTETLRNQLIEDGLLDDKISDYEALQEILQPIRDELERYKDARRNVLLPMPDRDDFERAMKETLERADK